VVLARLQLADRAVVTSGDYERFFEQDGVRYHHILDPRSGYPARLCQAVTVVAEQAALADAVATAAFVLGPELGMAFLRETEGVDGLIVAADGSVEVTTGLQELIEWP
jgi:thiamine biosynthesis lipoprotein